MVRVPAGCRVTGDSFVLDGEFEIYTTPLALTWHNLDMTAIIPADVQPLFRDLEADIKLIGSSKGVKIEDVKHLFAQKAVIHTFTLSLTMGLALLAVCVCGICCLRGRHFKKRYSNQLRGRFRSVPRGNSPTQEPHVTVELTD